MSCPPQLLESLLEKSQEIAFVKVNRTVVQKPSDCGRHLGKLRQLLSFYSQCTQAFRYSNFRGEFLDESCSMAGGVCIWLGLEGRIQTARDECHL